MSACPPPPRRPVSSASKAAAEMLCPRTGPHPGGAGERPGILTQKQQKPEEQQADGGSPHPPSLLSSSAARDVGRIHASADVPVVTLTDFQGQALWGLAPPALAVGGHDGDSVHSGRDWLPGCEACRRGCGEPANTSGVSGS